MLLYSFLAPLRIARRMYNICNTQKCSAIGAILDEAKFVPQGEYVSNNASLNIYGGFHMVFEFMLHGFWYH